jgi:hypothetical protein
MHGKHLTKEVKRIIYIMHFVNKLSAQDIFNIAFGGQTESELIVGLGRLQQICNNLDKWDVVKVNEWFTEENKQSGRPRRLSEQEEQYIVRIVHDNNALRLQAVATKFVEEFYNNDCDPVGKSLISKVLAKAG